jgi:hypothetical protein
MPRRMGSSGSREVVLGRSAILRRRQLYCPRPSFPSTPTVGAAVMKAYQEPRLVEWITEGANVDGRSTIN